MDDEVCIRDPHATEEDMQDYIALLRESGFREVREKAEDGTEQVYYRRLLREAYQCYASIALDYEDGLNLTASKYYDCPQYDSLDAINGAIGPRGYAALPASPDLQAATATDTANAMTESWLCFFHYDLGLEAELQFPDEEKAQAYMTAYAAAIEQAGFHPVYAGDTEEIDRYESENASASFRYRVEGGTALIFYKAERYTTTEEAQALIREAGFPEITLQEPFTCRDMREFQEYQYGRSYETYLTVSQTFAGMQEAEAFLSSYEEQLTGAGFGRVSPSEAGTNKQIAIRGEDSDLLVALDLMENSDGTAFVSFEFRAGDPED